MRRPGSDPDVSSWVYFFLIDPDCPFHWDRHQESMAIIRHWAELDLK